MFTVRQALLALLFSLPACGQFLNGIPVDMPSNVGTSAVVPNVGQLTHTFTIVQSDITGASCAAKYFEVQVSGSADVAKTFAYDLPQRIIAARFVGSGGVNVIRVIQATGEAPFIFLRYFTSDSTPPTCRFNAYYSGASTAVPFTKFPDGNSPVSSVSNSYNGMIDLSGIATASGDTTIATGGHLGLATAIYDVQLCTDTAQNIKLKDAGTGIAMWTWYTVAAGTCATLDAKGYAYMRTNSSISSGDLKINLAGASNVFYHISVHLE